MPDCKNLKICPFFNDKLKSKPGMLVTFKRIYCHEHFEKCARYIISKELGSEYVPRNLFPNQNERAEELIKKAHNNKE